MIKNRVNDRQNMSAGKSSVSLNTLKIKDLDIPTLTFLALFSYWYLFPQHFFPIIFQFKIPAIGVSICIIYSIVQFRYKNYRFVKAEIISLLILGGFFFLARYFVNDVGGSKFYSQEHFHAIFVGMVFFMNFQKMNKLHLITVLMIFYGTFTAFVGFREGGLIWTHNFLKDENQISAFMVMVIPVTIFYSFYTPKKHYRILCYLCASMQVALIIRSFSRSGLLALVAVSLCIFLKTRKKFFILILLLFSVVLIINYAPERFFDEVRSLNKGAEEATAHARMRFWGRAWRMFQDRPIIGHGIAQFPAENYRFRLPGELDRVTDRLVCHSNWFQILSELGLLGLFCYMVIWHRYFKSWYLIDKNPLKYPLTNLDSDEKSFYKNISTGLAIGMIGFMVAGTFINIMIFAYYYNFLFFMMTLKSNWLSKVKNLSA